MPSACSVCGLAGDGAHFGAEACRACAAFFRRSVALKKHYVCRNNGKCVIEASVRCMCRACRFSKCLAMGMKKSAVQRHREALGKREEQGDQSEGAACNEGSSSLLVEDEGMLTLTRLNTGYVHMNEIRNLIHSKDKLLSNKAPRAVAYKEANAVHTREVSLVADWILSSYPHFEKLDSNQKKVLFKSFFLPFVMLETGYYCVLNDRTDIIYLPSGDYIDTSRPETFYYDDQGKQKMSTEDAVKLFAPSFEIYRRNILDPMRRDRVDAFEFYTLCSLVLWDYGLEGQSSECEEVSRSVRESIIRELIFYYKHVRKLSHYTERLASLLILLPSLLRAVRRFQEDVEISHVFSVYSVDDAFYELVNGKF